MIELNGNTVIITKSAESIVGFLWFENGRYEVPPLEDNKLTKSNLPAGTYKVKEYNANGEVFDNEDIVIA